MRPIPWTPFWACPSRSRCSSLIPLVSQPARLKKGVFKDWPMVTNVSPSSAFNSSLLDTSAPRPGSLPRGCGPGAPRPWLPCFGRSEDISSTVLLLFRLYTSPYFGGRMIFSYYISFCCVFGVLTSVKDIVLLWRSRPPDDMKKHVVSSLCSIVFLCDHWAEGRRILRLTTLLVNIPAVVAVVMPSLGRRRETSFWQPRRAGGDGGASTF